MLFCRAIVWAPVVQGQTIWGTISGLGVFEGQLSWRAIIWGAIVLFPNKRYIRGNTEPGHKNVTPESDIFSRIIKENSSIRWHLWSTFNDAIDKSYFSTALKEAIITYLRQGNDNQKKMRDSCCQLCQKCLKNV